MSASNMGKAHISKARLFQIEIGAGQNNQQSASL